MNRQAGWWRNAIWWVAATILLVILYWACLRFAFPGYFLPLSPSHSDLYSFVGLSQVPWSWIVEKYPRPVGFLAMRAFSLFDLAGLMTLEIVTVLTSLLLTIRAVQKALELEYPWFLASIGFYALLLFAHPQFYFDHRHDVVAEVSYLFLVLALNLWLSWSARHSFIYAVGAFVCVAGFAFSKEQFFLSALCLCCAFVFADARNRKAHLIAMMVVIGAEAASYLWSRHVSSPFVQLEADPHDIYFMDTHLGSVARIYGHYLKQCLTIGLAAILALCFLRLTGRRRQMILLGGFVAAGLAAYLPISVLPNHVFDPYAWAGAPLLFAPVLVCFSPWVGAAGSRRPAAFFVAIAAFAIWTGAVFHSRYRVPELQWTIAQERVGRNVVNSFDRLKQIPRPSRVLVVGLETPFSPWFEPSFIRQEFGSQVGWTTVVPSDFSAIWADRVSRPSLAGDVRWSDYDYVAVYDHNGLLADLEPTKALLITVKEPAEILVPGLRDIDERIKNEPSNERLLAAAVGLCMRWGEWTEAVAYSERALSLAPSDAAMLEAHRVASQEIEARRNAKISFTANPPTIVSTTPDHLGVTKLFWDVPGSAVVELHVGSPDGPLLATGVQKGSAKTGLWVKDGMEFYLQDVSDNKPLTEANTLARVRVTVVSR